MLLASRRAGRLVRVAEGRGRWQGLQDQVRKRIGGEGCCEIKAEKGSRITRGRGSCGAVRAGQTVEQTRVRRMGGEISACVRELNDMVARGLTVGFGTPSQSPRRTPRPASYAQTQSSAH